MNDSRRNFIKKAAAGSAVLMAGGILPGFSAGSYGRIMGANDKIRVSAMGVNSRGNALAQNFAFQKECEVVHICDVDSRAVEKCVASVKKVQDFEPKGVGDFRKSLESKDVDLMVIAAPDHWHAPAALLAMQAGKHVYLEKPCSHNPAEGEILIEAAKRYKKSIQMGNQRRSWPNVMEAIDELKKGAIGRPYFGKGWYTNNRDSIGIGKKNRSPQMVRLGVMARPRTAKRFQRQHCTLQLALVLELGNRRSLEQRNAHGGFAALGLWGRLPDKSEFKRWALPLSGRLGNTRHSGNKS